MLDIEKYRISRFQAQQEMLKIQKEFLYNPSAENHNVLTVAQSNYRDSWVAYQVKLEEWRKEYSKVYNPS